MRLFESLDFYVKHVAPFDWVQRAFGKLDDRIKPLHWSLYVPIKGLLVILAFVGIEIVLILSWGVLLISIGLLILDGTWWLLCEAYRLRLAYWVAALVSIALSVWALRQLFST